MLCKSAVSVVDMSRIRVGLDIYSCTETAKHGSFTSSCRLLRAG